MSMVCIICALFFVFANLKFELEGGCGFLFSACRNAGCVEWIAIGRTFEVEGDSESLGARAQSFVVKPQGWAFLHGEDGGGGGWDRKQLQGAKKCVSMCFK